MRARFSDIRPTSVIVASLSQHQIIHAPNLVLVFSFHLVVYHRMLCMPPCSVTPCLVRVKRLSPHSTPSISWISEVSRPNWPPRCSLPQEARVEETALMLPWPRAQSERRGRYVLIAHAPKKSGGQNLISCPKSREMRRTRRSCCVFHSSASRIPSSLRFRGSNDV